MKMRILVAAVLSFCLAPAASAVVIMLDVDSTYNNVAGTTNPIVTQPGFTSYDAGSGAGGATAERTIDVDGVSITFFGGIDGSRQRNDDVGGGGGGAYDALLRDFVFNDGSGAAVALRLANLPLGVYDVQSWHYDGLAGTPGMTQVEVRNQGVANTVILADAVPFSTEPIRYQIVVDEPGEVLELVFRDDDPVNNRSRFNGITIQTVPEPTGAGMLLGALALGLRRRRR